MPSSHREVEELRAYIRGLPKIELHAHLSGSIRESTIIELIHQHYTPDEVEQQIRVCKLKADDPNEKRDLNECFALFKVLHRIVSNKEILHRITLEVLEDFVFDDRVMYLELRTTPRPIVYTSADGAQQEMCSKYEYITTICDAMKEFKAAVAFINTYLHTISPDITSPTAPAAGNSILPWVNDESESSILSDDALAGFSPAAQAIIAKRIRDRSAAFWFVDSSLLLSFDRSADLQEAEDTLMLAVKARQEGCPVSGLDFSGNPYNRSFSEFAPLFERARSLYGFPLSIHFAETPNIQDSVDILAFFPDRVGHAAVLNEYLYEQLVALKIPVEVCLTSNASCKLHAMIDTHPLLSLYRHRHPVVLCTDDKGVFGSSLVDEWQQLLQLRPFNHTGGINIDELPHCIVHFPTEEARRIGVKQGLENPLNPLPSPVVAGNMPENAIPFALSYLSSQNSGLKAGSSSRSSVFTSVTDISMSVQGLSLQTSPSGAPVTSTSTSTSSSASTSFSSTSISTKLMPTSTTITLNTEECTCPHTSALNSLLTSSIMPPSILSEPTVPTTLKEAKEALWIFAGSGISACFAKPAIKAHMQNMLMMFKP